MTNVIRMGYIKGNAYRINERFVDKMLIKYFGEYIKMVPISPMTVIKLFNISFVKWIKGLPGTLDIVETRLNALKRKLNISILYLNFPEVIPYLFIARSLKKINLIFFIVVHCVANQSWLRLWISIAPFLTNKDIIICSTRASYRALLKISPAYKIALRFPLFLETDNETIKERSKYKTILSIGRIENTKNIHLLLEIFARVRRMHGQSKLYIVGEYTGNDKQLVDKYKDIINKLMIKHDLADDVIFTGPLVGNAKEPIFAKSDVLVNLSTDPGETFGYNIIEAKKWGIPVVCTRWNGFKEIVKQGSDGFLISCGWQNNNIRINTRQAVARLSCLLKNDKVLKKMSCNARQAVFKYDYTEVIPRIMESIRNIEKNKEQAANIDIASLYLKIKELKNIYHPQFRKNVIFNNHTPLTILAYQELTQGKNWLINVRSIIKHY